MQTLEKKVQTAEKKILLIDPPFDRLHNINTSLNRFPLSLGYLAGMIRQKKPDWKVRIYNADFSPNDVSLSYEFMGKQGFDNYIKALHDPESRIWKEVEEQIKNVAPDVIGITCKSQSYASACIVARIAKSINPDVLIVFGGPHPSLIKKDLLDEPLVDIGVMGEGEETMVDILDYFEGNRPLSAVNGIVYREGGKTVESDPREPIYELDTLPFPNNYAKECLINYEQYPLQAFMYIFALRGCPYACTFCGSRYIWTRKVRFRTVDNVIEEIKDIQKMGISYVHFDDDTFGVRRPFIEELCEKIIKHCPGLKWSCEIHVKLVDDEIMTLMKSAGCRSVMIGVESGSNKMLKLIKKGMTIEQAFEAAKIIKSKGIYIHTFFMVGFPQETEETLDETIKAITTIPTDSVVYSVFTPYIGTELFELCKKEGIIPDNFDVSLYNHHSPENYFCLNIPKDVFVSRVRQLEKKLDQINMRKKLRMYLSREGLLKLKQKGIKRTLSRIKHYVEEMAFCK